MSKYINAICDCCNSTFQKIKHRYTESIKNNWKLFCSKDCKNKYHTKTHEVLCDSCGKKFIKSNSDMKKTFHNFCSHTCSAKYSNTNRKMKEETKTKISNKLKNIKKTPEQKMILKQKRIKSGHYSGRPYTKIQIINCPICGKLFCSKAYRKRKTCSPQCKIIASTKIRTYQNGSRKTTWFFNPYQNKKVLLESSWEVKTAELLCKYNIEWIRPDPLKWIDNTGKDHLYFPDFYLPKHDTYLDPKNPFCLKRDKEKINYFTNRIKLIYGQLSIIFKYVEDIKSEVGDSNTCNLVPKTSA